MRGVGGRVLLARIWAGQRDRENSLSKGAADATHRRPLGQLGQVWRQAPHWQDGPHWHGLHRHSRLAVVPHWQGLQRQGLQRQPLLRSAVVVSAVFIVVTLSFPLGDSPNSLSTMVQGQATFS